MTNTNTYQQKPAEVTREWLVVDAKGRVLGEVASEIAFKLIGKHKVTYTPHVDGGDYVVVINAKEVEVSGTKATNKVYYRYSGYPGGLSKKTFAEVQADRPERIIEQAVYNMLPKNKLRTFRMDRLKVYAGAEHKHQSQVKG
ncbi:MAG TPA: 50S ribosomal protein L13 [Vitreimonas sp.]|nr:50S ribosomal protein L13 [Vitreimonas sp.]